VASLDSFGNVKVVCQLHVFAGKGRDVISCEHNSLGLGLMRLLTIRDGCQLIQLTRSDGRLVRGRKMTSLREYRLPKCLAVFFLFST
jgi:hypothetical protein